MTEGLNLDEVGPPPIDDGVLTLAEIVRRVNAAGIALDQVVVVSESLPGSDIYLDWAKNWKRPEPVEDPEADEADQTVGDALEGW